MTYTEQDLQRMFKHLLDTAKYRNQRIMITGRRTGSGPNDVTMAGAPANRVWVRWPDDSREQTLAWGWVSQRNIAVVVENDPGGELYIVRAEYTAATAQAGSGLGSAMMPPISGAAANIDIVGRNLRYGRVRPTARQNDLNVVVEAFSSIYGTFSETEFEMTPPATANTKAYCIVVYDPTIDALTQVTGTLQSSIYQPMVGDEWLHVEFPALVVPLGGVLLSHGQTAIRNTDYFVDMRYHIAHRGTFYGNYGQDFLALTSY